MLAGLRPASPWARSIHPGARAPGPPRPRLRSAWSRTRARGRLNAWPGRRH